MIAPNTNTNAVYRFQWIRLIWPSWQKRDFLAASFVVARSTYTSQFPPAAINSRPCRSLIVPSQLTTSTAAEAKMRRCHRCRAGNRSQQVRRGRGGSCHRRSTDREGQAGAGRCRRRRRRRQFIIVDGRSACGRPAMRRCNGRMRRANRPPSRRWKRELVGRDVFVAGWWRWRAMRRAAVTSTKIWRFRAEARGARHGLLYNSAYNNAVIQDSIPERRVNAHFYL